MSIFLILIIILTFLKVLLSTLAFTAFELPPNGAVGTKILEFLFHSRSDLVRPMSMHFLFLVCIFVIIVSYSHSGKRHTEVTEHAHADTDTSNKFFFFCVCKWGIFLLLILWSSWDIADLMVLQTCTKLQVTLTLSHFT